MADFGLARDIYNRAYYASTDVEARLPLRWMSPEVFQSQKFGEASDVWAFGVTLIELYSQAATPYGEWSNILVLERLKDGYVLPRPADCPVAVYNEAIAPCFLEEPRERPSFQSLCTRLGTAAQLESPLASPPQNTGGDGRVDRSALVKQSDEGRADGVATDGAYFGFGRGAQNSLGVDTARAAVAVAGRRSTSALDAGPGQSGDAIGFFDGIYPHRGGSGPARGPNRHLYRPRASTGLQQQQQRRRQLYATGPGGRLTPTATVALERTEELESGQSVTPLEAQMFRVLQNIDADDAHDHILKIRLLADAQLSEVIKIDGVPWLTTEVDLLGELPEDSRSAFRRRAHSRAKRLPDAELAWVESHYESLFISTARGGNPDALSRHCSSEQVYGASVLEDMPFNPRGFDVAPGTVAPPPQRRRGSGTRGADGNTVFSVEEGTDI